METILVLDFGGQYTHLIASRIRRLGYYTEVISAEKFSVEQMNDDVKGFILSGGPQSVYDKTAPITDKKIFQTKKPILAICYGFQWICYQFGGHVVSNDNKEYGRTTVAHQEKNLLFHDIPESSFFWMSHSDQVVQLPDDFISIASTTNCEYAAVYSEKHQIFGIQFHPEVSHSEYGETLFLNFIHYCRIEKNWSIEQFYQNKKKQLMTQINNRKVILFVSGGVDSTVCFVLLSQIIGKKNVVGLFIDHGLLRKNEKEKVQTALHELGFQLVVLDKKDDFLNRLEQIVDAEEKRNWIGKMFLEAQSEFFQQNQLDENWILAQGTIYPDTIESGKTKNSDKIKTHHNCIPEVIEMIEKGLVIEPIADLYKDEVRELGEYLGIPSNLTKRHPFPGPGLAVRILCSKENQQIQINSTEKSDFFKLPIKSVGVQGDQRTYKKPAVIIPTKNTKDDLNLLKRRATEIINKNNQINRCLYLLNWKSSQEVQSIFMYESYLSENRIQLLQEIDAIVHDELIAAKQYDLIWQFPVVLVPISFEQSTKESIILRPIDSVDAMSAEVGQLCFQFLNKLTEKILKFDLISAVFLDLTSKPPGTIEWE